MLKSQTSRAANTLTKFRFCRTSLTCLVTKGDIGGCAKRVSRKLRPRKHRPQTSDLENPDLENTDLENPDLENTDLENPDLAI